jgi:hypothetical protein
MPAPTTRGQIPAWNVLAVVAVVLIGFVTSRLAFGPIWFWFSAIEITIVCTTIVVAIQAVNLRIRPQQDPLEKQDRGVAPVLLTIVVRGTAVIICVIAVLNFVILSLALSEPFTKGAGILERLLFGDWRPWEFTSMYFWRVDSVWVFPSTIFALIALLFLSVLPSAMENRLVRVATYLAIAWFIVFPLYHLTFRF